MQKWRKKRSLDRALDKESKGKARGDEEVFYNHTAARRRLNINNNKKYEHRKNRVSTKTGVIGDNDDVLLHSWRAWLLPDGTWHLCQILIQNRTRSIQPLQTPTFYLIKFSQ